LTFSRSLKVKDIDLGQGGPQSNMVEYQNEKFGAGERGTSLGSIRSSVSLAVGDGRAYRLAHGRTALDARVVGYGAVTPHGLAEDKDGNIWFGD